MNNEQETHSAFSRSGPAGGGRIIWLIGPDAENRDALAEALAGMLAEKGAMVMLLPDRDEDGKVEEAKPAKIAEGAVKAAADGLTVVIGADADTDTLSMVRDKVDLFAQFLVYDGEKHADVAATAFADVRLDTAVLDGAAACELCLAFLDNWQ